MLAVIFNSLSQSPSFLPIFMYCLYNLLSSFDNFLMFSVTQGGTLSSAVISLFGTKLVNIFNKNYLIVAVLMNRRENNTIRNHIRLISECKVNTKTWSRKEMSWFRWECFRPFMFKLFLQILIFLETFRHILSHFLLKNTWHAICYFVN